MRYQVIALEHKAYGMVPVGIPIPVLVFFCRYAIDYQVAAVIAVKTADDIEKRSLARTARPEYCHKLVITEAQAHIVKSCLSKISRDVFFSDIFDRQQSTFPPVDPSISLRGQIYRSYI